MRTKATIAAAMARRFRVGRFMGLDSVGVAKASRGGGENEVQNPKAFVFVAFDSLVISEDSDSIGKAVPIHVHETGTEEGDCCVNAFE
jgi:hypothetical protein